MGAYIFFSTQIMHRFSLGGDLINDHVHLFFHTTFVSTCFGEETLLLVKSTGNQNLRKQKFYWYFG